jgi:hypothetical protein
MAWVDRAPLHGSSGCRDEDAGARMSLTEEKQLRDRWLGSALDDSYLVKVEVYGR